MREVKTHACCIIEPSKITFYHAKRCFTLRRVLLTLKTDNDWRFCCPSLNVLILDQEKETSIQGGSF